MSAKKAWPGLGGGEDGNDSFGDLRAAYRMRLRSDRARLVALRTRLGGVTIPSALYEGIQRTAHDIAGAAAVFQVTSLVDVALRLDHAAAAMAVAPCTDRRIGVDEELEKLIAALDMICQPD